MRAEKPYDFKKRYCRVHKTIRNWKEKTPEAEELVLNAEVAICLNCEDQVAKTAVKDFKAFLKTAFGFSAKSVAEGGDLQIAIDPAMTDYMSRKITVWDKGITIAAADERGIAQALYDLENMLTERKAPFLKKGVTEKKPLFSPRMVHSGYGMDEYPDEYLNVCAHHGFDAILVYVAAPRKSRPYFTEEYDFSDLIRRAAKYGIDVYAYCCATNFVHPEEEGAKEKYDAVYGEIFRAHPFKGMVFVGESVEFPSKDTRSTGLKHRTLPPDGIPTGKQSPGWFPCYDYAQWVCLVRDTIRNVKPDADIVFWTYNWGWAPEEDRLALIDRLPTDISLLVTFEMFQQYKIGNSTGRVSDYSIYFPGPGAYFASEAKRAKARGLRLYTQANSAGRSWDFGVAPYEPFPGRWNMRNEALLKAHEDWGLSGLMETHHMGFTPSFITKLSRETFSAGSESYQARLEQLAKDYSEKDYQKILEAFRQLDASVDGVIPSVENQYGPYRIGPAYPFCIKTPLKMPNRPGAVYGNGIYKVRDQFQDSEFVSPYSVRIFDEMRLAKLAMTHTKNAVKILKSIPNKSPGLQRLLNLSRFLVCCHQTAIHFQKFYLLRGKLLTATKIEEVNKYAKAIEILTDAERKNVMAAIPLAQKDSALGYEPSMDYVCDEEALLWKLKQLEYIVSVELKPYKLEERL